MIQLRIRREHVAITRAHRSQTEVDVVERYSEPLVEPAQLVPQFAPHHPAGGCDRGVVLQQHCSAAVPWVVPRQESIHVPRDPMYSRDDARVLDGIIRIEKLCTDDTDPGPESLRHHLSQPPWRYH